MATRPHGYGLAAQMSFHGAGRAFFAGSLSDELISRADVKAPKLLLHVTFVTCGRCLWQLRHVQRRRATEQYNNHFDFAPTPPAGNVNYLSCLIRPPS